VEPQVAFYQLSRKVVNNQESIPMDARQVMYYSLAIGHHVGVMDCLSELMAVPIEKYRRCLAHLPEGEARRKLEGVLTWNEVEINRGHVGKLLPALTEALSRMNSSDSEWVKTMILCLQNMAAEPALYLMLRVRG
jgi:Formate hydrogenlyase maturation protein HycH